MTAVEALRDNIRYRLDKDLIHQKSLADRLGHHKSWLNKFLRGSRPQLSMVDLDEIAAFFQVEVYKLFIPRAGADVQRSRGVTTIVGRRAPHRTTEVRRRRA